MVSGYEEDRKNEEQKQPESSAPDVEETVGDVDDEGSEEGMENWADLAEAGPVEVQRGQILKGVVVAVTDEGVSVDIGSKLEGLVSMTEFAGPEELPQVNDEIDVAVLRVDEKADVVRLSKRRADFERVWVELAKAAKEQTSVDAMVVERVKGGLRVDVGVPGFVPASHVGTRNPRSLERFVGQTLKLKVLEVDRRDKKVILSHRQAVEEERAQQREETMADIDEGVVVEGKVRNLTSYGAFVDLGGVDGLLHVSEMSWGRVQDPSDVVKVGDTIRAMVLEVDTKRDRISLSMRQILPDPWKEAAKDLRSGQLVTGKITRIVRTGAFAMIVGKDIEGFIPISEMSSTKRINDPKEVLSEGQEVELKIIDIRTPARKMSLSLVGAEQDKERREYKDYMSTQSSSRITLGDQFGDILQQVEVQESDAEQDEASKQDETPAGEEPLVTDDQADDAEESES